MSVQASMSSLKGNESNVAADLIVNTSMQAASGALAGYLFTIVTPAVGAVFGVIWGATSSIVASILDNSFGNSTNEKIVKFAAKTLGSIAMAAMVTTFAGYAITFSAGVKLCLLMIPTGLITKAVYNIIKTAS